MIRITRRATLAGALAGAATARAQGNPLVVFAHRVHQTVAAPPGGPDVTAAFTQATGVPVQWATFDTNPLGERLMREASLAETSVDVGFLVNTQIVPRIASLFEPLDPYLQKDPVEDPADIFPGLMSGMRVGGAQVGMPVRHASSGLHYNEAILLERGVAPPTTIEEMIEGARKCTFRRDDGTRVVGLVMPGVTYPNVIDLARAWDGDFITQDYKCVADQPGMLHAIHALRSLFQAGAFPRNFATMSSEDTATWVQGGRAAFVLQSMGRNRIFNDPKAGPYAGKIRTVAIPASATMKDKFAVAPAKVEFWGMVIPHHAARKDLSWQFIKSMLTEQATLQMALAGNGPVRSSTYADPGFRAKVPYADEERRVLQVARVPIPAFDQAARAGDYFKEEAEAAVLGMKTPEEAMGDLVRRVTPLLG